MNMNMNMSKRAERKERLRAKREALRLAAFHALRETSDEYRIGTPEFIKHAAENYEERIRTLHGVNPNDANDVMLIQLAMAEVLDKITGEFTGEVRGEVRGEAI